MENNRFYPRIGEVYSMYFDGAGSTQRGWRPGVVFQNDIGNIFSPNVIALPLTSSIKKIGQPTHVVLDAAETGLRMDSMVLCENPSCVPKEMVGDYITTIPARHMKKIAAASLLATSAITYLDQETLLATWKEAAGMCKKNYCEEADPRNAGSNTPCDSCAQLWPGNDSRL